MVVTLSVPKPVRGWDWGCALQITGLDTAWQRPKYVFGIDGLQALCRQLERTYKKKLAGQRRRIG